LTLTGSTIGTHDPRDTPPEDRANKGRYRWRPKRGVTSEVVLRTSLTPGMTTRAMKTQTARQPDAGEMNGNTKEQTNGNTKEQTNGSANEQMNMILRIIQEHAQQQTVQMNHHGKLITRHYSSESHERHQEGASCYPRKTRENHQNNGQPSQRFCWKSSHAWLTAPWRHLAKY
jgi:hypothetical protein